MSLRSLSSFGFSFLSKSVLRHADKLSLACLQSKSLFRYVHTIPFVLSDIGEGIVDVVVKEWLVEPGQKVRQFDEICEVQSDKAAVTISSRYDGTVRKLHYDVNDTASVGEPLLDIEVADDINSKSVEEEVSVKDEGGSSNASPLTTPAVRRLATEHGVNLNEVSGTGKDGRVLKEDILMFLESRSDGSQTLQPPDDINREITGFTKAMCNVMTEALSIPHFCYYDEIDVSQLSKTRRSANEFLDTQKKGGISFLPYFIKACSLALLEFPVINSHFDYSSLRMTTSKHHNIGLAMDTPFGLIVPNVKNAQDLSVIEIAEEIDRLRELGLAAKLSPTELSDATITLSNIGSIGGTFAKPIIVPPQVVIGAFGAIRRLPRYVGDSQHVVPTEIMNVSWSADHRVIDGATIARFSNKVKQFLQFPASMVLHLR